MAYPNFAADAPPFILDTDGSSSVGIGAVLSQVQPDGTERVIAFGSRTLSSAERNYCTTRVELLAVVTFIRQFRYFLLGKRFILRTDHSSLRWLHSFKNIEGQAARWLEQLSNFDYTIVHRAGKDHQNADGLSRRPRSHFGMDTCPTCSDESRVSSVVFGSGLLEKIRKAQIEHPELSRLRSAVQSSESGAEVAKQSADSQLTPFMKALMARKDELLMDRELLCLRSTKGCKIVLPYELVGAVIAELHGGSSGAHAGFFKTKKKVTSRFWHPGLGRMVEEFIRGCVTCGRSKTKLRGRAPLEPIQSGAPFERVMIDIVGPLPRSKRGNHYILTIQDAFSKWPDAYPLRNQKAISCARVLVERWVSQHGCPQFLHSDQGRNFESKLTAELCKLLAIKKTRTTPYHPMGNGQVESFNRTLGSSLRSLMVDEGKPQSSWEEFLPAVLMAYRSSVHRGTGYTPHFLVYGTEMRLPIDLVNRPPQEQIQNPVEYVDELRQKLQAAGEAVRKNLSTYQRVQKDHYDAGVRGKAFEPGDLVYVYQPCLEVGEAKKFHVYWTGPVQVFERQGQSRYVVGHPTIKRRKKTVHSNNLALYRRAPEAERQAENFNDAAVEGDVRPPEQDEESESDDDGQLPPPPPPFMVQPTHEQSAVADLPAGHPGSPAANSTPVRRYPARNRAPTQFFGNPVRH